MGWFYVGLPAEESRHVKDQWAKLVDRCREGLCVRVCTSEHGKTSAQEGEEQAAKLALMTTRGWGWWVTRQEATAVRQRCDAYKAGDQHYNMLRRKRSDATSSEEMLQQWKSFK